MQPRFLLIALGATLFGAQNAAAEDTDVKKIYADLGYSRIESDLLDRNTLGPTLEFGGVSGHVGYRFSEHWSIEGEAIVGVENNKQFSRYVSQQVEGSRSVRQTETTDLNHLVGVYVRGTIPITKKFNAFARLGMTVSEVDQDFQSVITDLETEETIARRNSFTNTEHGVAMGLGLNYDVTDSVYVRGDYTQYDWPYIDMENASLSIGFRF
ncbi:MAG: porin family protein [Pseudomonadota bacterium]